MPGAVHCTPQEHGVEGINEFVELFAFLGGDKNIDILCVWRIIGARGTEITMSQPCLANGLQVYRTSIFTNME